MVFVLILGIIAFLLIEHTLVFWLVFVPLAILFILFLVSFFTSRRGWISRVRNRDDYFSGNGDNTDDSVYPIIYFDFLVQ